MTCSDSVVSGQGQRDEAQNARLVHHEGRVNEHEISSCASSIPECNVIVSRSGKTPEASTEDRQLERPPAGNGAVHGTCHRDARCPTRTRAGQEPVATAVFLTLLELPADGALARRGSGRRVPPGVPDCFACRRARWCLSAIDRLVNPLALDSTIPCFEFTIELFWEGHEAPAGNRGVEGHPGL